MKRAAMSGRVRNSVNSQTETVLKLGRPIETRWSRTEDARKKACKCSFELASRNQQNIKRKATEDMANDVFRGPSRTEDQLVRGKESSQLQ